MKAENLIVHPKKPQGEDGHRVFSVRLREKTVAGIEAVYVQSDCSRNSIINMMPDYALTHCEVADPEKRRISLGFSLCQAK